MSDNYRRFLNSARLADLALAARRVLGLPYLSQASFLPEIAAADAARIAALARRARGDTPVPILVLGIMPRSGTNFLRDLLAEHPDTHADPGRLYEFPLLQAAGSAAAFMDDFILRFPVNAEVVTRWDALALCAGGWLRVLQDEAGGRRILLKSPHVENLSLAPLVFAGAKIVLCLRDGRDVVDSTLRTFGRWSPARKSFRQLALNWKLGAESIMAYAEGGPRAHPDVVVVRYEDLLEAPEPTMRGLLDQLGLDTARYDFGKVRAMPVRGSSRSTLDQAQRWQPQPQTADFNPLGRWKNWPPARLARFHALAGDALKEAGYDG